MIHGIDPTARLVRSCGPLEKDLIKPLDKMVRRAGGRKHAIFKTLDMENCTPVYIGGGKPPEPAIRRSQVRK